MEPIMKLRICIDEAQRRGETLFLNGEDLNRAFDSPERAIKDIALRRLSVPKSVVKFLAEIDEGNEVHIITSYGVTYGTPGLEKDSKPNAVSSRAHQSAPSYGWL